MRGTLALVLNAFFCRVFFFLAVLSLDLCCGLFLYILLMSLFLHLFYSCYILHRAFSLRRAENACLLSSLKSPAWMGSTTTTQHVRSVRVKTLGMKTYRTEQTPPHPLR